MRRYSEIRREKKLILLKKILVIFSISAMVIVAGVLTSVFLKHNPSSVTVINKIENVANKINTQTQKSKLCKLIGGSIK